MPYIPDYDRRRAEVAPQSPGELNYAITMLLKNYFRAHGAGYGAINDCIGALEGAKLEFYRRVASPYEDTKIEQNGDVYG